jgi:Stage II sporulation protein E (SpoIIE)
MINLAGALSHGRAALIAGDAMGHDQQAAAAMTQLRTVAHALGDLDLPSRSAAAH